MKTQHAPTNPLLLILAILTIGFVTHTTAQSWPPPGGPEYFTSYYSPNPFNPSTVSITNRSSQAVWYGCYFACELQDNNSEQILFSAGGIDMEITGTVSENGGFVSYIPEFVSWDFMEWFAPLYENTLYNISMYGVDVDGTLTHMTRGGWLPYVVPPEGTVLTVNWWTDSSGSFHLEFIIDDEPEP